MSIKRIESSYATFFNDKKLSGAEMAVLIALSYVANDKDEKKCYPADDYLIKLTHFSRRAVQNARKVLKSRNIITWENRGKGGKGKGFSNKYTFLFPHRTLKSQYESYQQLETHPTPDTLTKSMPTAHDVRTRCAPDAHPLRTTCASPAHDVRTNTEENRNKTSESKSESGSAFQRALSEVSFGLNLKVDESATKTMSAQIADEQRSIKKKEQISIIVEALRACKVNDLENKRTFSKIMMWRNPDDCLEVIKTFKSEIKQGEHDKANNLAAILTTRLKALPKIASS